MVGKRGRIKDTYIPDWTDEELAKAMSEFEEASKGLEEFWNEWWSALESGKPLPVEAIKRHRPLRWRLQPESMSWRPLYYL